VRKDDFFGPDLSGVSVSSSKLGKAAVKLVGEVYGGKDKTLQAKATSEFNHLRLGMNLEAIDEALREEVRVMISSHAYPSAVRTVQCGPCR
jgi:hypothetical protein